LAHADAKTLASVLGIRLYSDGKLEIPLQHTWKPFSRLEFAPLGLVFPFGVVLAYPTPGHVSCYAAYAFASLLLYLALAATLIVRRRLVVYVNSGVATLVQSGRSHGLSIGGVVLGSAKRKSCPYIILDGIPYPLAVRFWVGRARRMVAVKALRDITNPTASPLMPAAESAAAFLAIAGDVYVSAMEVRLRAIWSPLSHYVFIANAVAPVAIVIVGMFAIPSTQNSATVFGVKLVLAWLVNLGAIIYLRRCKPYITITSAKWTEVHEHGDTYKCPPWQARFVVTSPESSISDESIGPVYPYIELKYGNRSLTVHSSRIYDAKELEGFADRMNHYLWGSTRQPEDPAKSWAQA
jgi:hypothetical protein